MDSKLLFGLVFVVFTLGSLPGLYGQGTENVLGTQIVYGPLKTKQATSTAPYEDYTSSAICPPDTVVVGCQSITTGCAFDGSAYRQDSRTCVTWNSMTFWGVQCPDSTVQAVAICGSGKEGAPQVDYDLHEDESGCDIHPGSVLVGCSCAIVYGHEVACAGAIPSGQNCTASPDSPLVNPGSLCLQGVTDRQIIEIEVADGVGTGECPDGYLMTDCTCSGKGCLGKTIAENECGVEVNDSEGFQGAFVICAAMNIPQ